MMVSTKGRYALRVMLDLAMQKQEEYVSLNDIAQRQKISRRKRTRISSPDRLPAEWEKHLPSALHKKCLRSSGSISQ